MSTWFSLTGQGDIDATLAGKPVVMDVAVGPYGIRVAGWSEDMRAQAEFVLEPLAAKALYHALARAFVQHEREHAG